MESREGNAQWSLIDRFKNEYSFFVPRVSRSHTEARRRQILEAAWICFARKGFHRTTMPEICKEAGVSTGAVYSYFPSKERIIEEGARRALGATLEAMGQVARAAPASMALPELLRFFVLGLATAERRRLVRSDLALWGEAVTNPRIAAVMARNVRGLRTRIGAIVRRAQNEGAVDPALDPGAVARAVLSLYLGVALQSLVDPGFDAGAYAEVISRLRFGSC